MTIAGGSRPRTRHDPLHDPGQCRGGLGRSSRGHCRPPPARYPALAAHDCPIARFAPAVRRAPAGDGHCERVLFQAGARQAVAEPAGRNALSSLRRRAPRNSTSRSRSIGSSKLSIGGSSGSSTNGRASGASHPTACRLWARSGQPGLLLVRGQGGYGIQTAPAAARLAAQILLLKGDDTLTAGLDRDRYAAGRFA